MFTRTRGKIPALAAVIAASNRTSLISMPKKFTIAPVSFAIIGFFGSV
jgi:hypothetical protein